MTSGNIFGFRAIRKSKNLTLKAISDASGINIRTLENYDAGKTSLANASCKTVYCIAKVLEVDIERLILPEIENKEDAIRADSDYHE